MYVEGTAITKDIMPAEVQWRFEESKGSLSIVRTVKLYL